MDGASGSPYGVGFSAGEWARTPRYVDRDGQETDGGLHAAEVLTCYACEVEIHDKDWIRRGPKGTRHDVCP